MIDELFQLVNLVLYVAVLGLGVFVFLELRRHMPKRERDRFTLGGVVTIVAFVLGLVAGNIGSIWLLRVADIGYAVGMLLLLLGVLAFAKQRQAVSKRHR